MGEACCGLVSYSIACLYCIGKDQAWNSYYLDFIVLKRHILIFFFGGGFLAETIWNLIFTSSSACTRLAHVLQWLRLERMQSNVIWSLWANGISSKEQRTSVCHVCYVVAPKPASKLLFPVFPAFKVKKKKKSLANNIEFDCNH